MSRADHDSADRASLERLPPGPEVAFTVVDERTARAAAAHRWVTRETAVAALREAAPCDALWHGAGG